MMFILIILAIIGVLVYALANGKAAELGRLLFACALLVICFELAHGVTALAQLQRLGR